jgi:predicted ATPase/DNA-binding CsgD family transcriptional regulator
MDARDDERTPVTGQTAGAGRFLSAREAAAALGVNERTIRRAITRGDLVAAKYSGVYRIEPAALSDFQARQQVPSSPLRDPRSDPPRLIPLPKPTDEIAATLPRPLTSLIGREREVEQIGDLLRRDGVRLVTLIGPGGVGKTRLAIAVAELVRDHFGDGVVFASLAPIRHPDLVASAVAQTLGVRETGDRPLVDGLKRHLHDRYLLLLVDNFEQVLPAAPLIGELLAAAPRLTVLVTSRAVLRLSGEHTVQVPPLSLPDPGGRLSLTEVVRSEAVRLFAEQAAAAQSGFVLTEANAHVIAKICLRLDGLPLAIELAAARIPLLPPSALLARLEYRLPLLTGGARDHPARLQTMRDAIAWSYDLLAPHEQALFRRLAVFVGGFTLDAAEAICEGIGNREPGTGGGGRAPVLGSPTAVPSVFDGLASLVDKSLVQRMTGTPSGEDQEPRFEMLETVREYGLEQLAASGDDEAARDAHVTFFRAFAERLAPRQLGGNPVAWLDRLAADHDNLRAALDRLCRADTAEDCLRLTADCCWFWSRRGHITEGRARLERALALAGPEPTAGKCRALRYAIDFALDAGDLPAAMALTQEGMAVADAVGDRRLRALMLNSLAYVDDGYGRWDAASARYREGLAIWREIGEPRPAAMVLMCLGVLSYTQGDPIRARSCLDEAATIFRDLGDRTWTYAIESHLGEFALAEGRIGEAARRFRKSLRGFTYAGEALYLLSPLLGLAACAVEAGRPETAAHLLGAAYAQLQRTGAGLISDNRLAYERDEARARSLLGDAAFASSYAVGRSFDPSAWLAAADLVVAAAEQVSARALSRSAGELAGLTPRETEILRLVAASRSNREIAGTLFISVPTVKRHLTTILGKLGVPSRAEAAAYARAHGLA